MATSCYFANLRYGLRWNKARMARFGDIRTLERLRDGGPTWRPTHPRILQALRHWKRMSFGMRRLRPWIVVPNGGWHLTSMNGPEAVAEKLNAYSHANRSATPEAIADRFKRALGSSASGTGFQLVEPGTDLPAFLAANQSRFAHLIADRQTFERFGVALPGEFPDPPGQSKSAIEAAT
jgi:beta-1,4-mannosyl-glycoprotein beta-1,4-N-acetylglucosaminyltransferase